MESSIGKEICNNFRSGFLALPGSDCTSGNLFLGLSWPPRSYTCSFCKREFRSAQALGGHMNVHRRDRARLRESSPLWEPPPGSKPDNVSNPKINPNRLLHLNLNSVPEPTYDGVDPPATRASTSPIFSLSPLSSYARKKFEARPSELRVSKNRKVSKAVKEISETKEYSGKDSTCKVLKRKNGARGLHMESGLESDTPMESLDLNLRLGYA